MDFGGCAEQFSFGYISLTRGDDFVRTAVRKFHSVHGLAVLGITAVQSRRHGRGNRALNARQIQHLLLLLIVVYRIEKVYVDHVEPRGVVFGLANVAANCSSDDFTQGSCVLLCCNDQGRTVQQQ